MGRSTVAKGPESEESISGADAIIVLKSEVPHIKANKGFLFKQKNTMGEAILEALEHLRLKNNAKKCLSLQTVPTL